MEKTCAQCQVSFAFTDTDKALLDKCSPTINGVQYRLLEPVCCFDCRLQRRVAFYNSRSIYKRQCSLTGQDIVSVYSPDKPFTVYERKTWYGDSWNPLDYGQDYDFNRSFFEQFYELMQRVPLMSLGVLSDNINSDYTNDNLGLKNCYLVFDGERGEDCLYGHTFAGAMNCVDMLCLTDCELCYECIHLDQCYDCKFCFFSTNCHNSWFLRDCIGCKDCFGCTNLRQKQFCIYNEQKTEEEYHQFIDAIDSASYTMLEELKVTVLSFLAQQPYKAVRQEQNIDVVGDNVVRSKDSYYCFDAIGVQDCRFCTNVLVGAKDSMDIHIWGGGMERSYNNCVTGIDLLHVIGCYYVSEGCTDVYYSMYCSRQSSNVMGCIGLKHKQYCILNKQYTKEEYEVLMPKIIKHMQSTGEWGRYFDPTISGFGYNETMAQFFFPLTKQEVLERGWQWSDFEPELNASRTIPAQQLPDTIDDIPDDVLHWAIVCSVSSKPFKITKAELQFYRQHRLPVPRLHPDERHRIRFNNKNPYKLWERACHQCQKNVLSSYSSSDLETIYCEECYLAEVY